MTYHLARVAHWMQFRSVGAYPTNITRQVVLTPGAEYVLLALQAISGSERFANLLQYAAWLLLAASAPTLARTFGAPRALARWSALLVAAAPMAVLQASSSQNDLVASLMTLAVVFACLPFLHGGRCRWRWPDAVLLLVAVTAALLVKPTSVVVATPFLLGCGWLAVRTLRQRAAWRQLLLALPAVLLAAGALAPFLATRRATFDNGVTKPFVYAGWDQPGDRLLNSVRGVLRDVPLPWAVFDRLSPAETPGCGTAHGLCLKLNLKLHEDYSGSIGAVLVFLVAALVGVIRWRTLPGRARLGLVCLLSAWVLFHAILRDNVWITRLHLPLIALVPASLGVFKARWLTRRAGVAALSLLLVGVAAHGALAATRNALRPLSPRRVLQGQAAEAYYLGGPGGVGPLHDAALQAVERLSCRRLGLYIGGDSYDYPLTWRAMQAGTEVRHVVGPDDWPCVVFSDRGPPPPRPSGDAWRAIGESTSLYAAPDHPGATPTRTGPVDEGQPTR